MRHVTILVADPQSQASIVSLTQQVDHQLSDHPWAVVTWLQSSASRTYRGNTINAEHVLTCVVEWDDVPKAKRK